jgi:hypothetical protein
MSIARQRFCNTRTRGNEQTWKSIASQRLVKHTFPWQRIHELLDMVIYIRFAWKLVHFGGVDLQESSMSRKTVVKSLWSVNQRITEAEEVTDS